MFAANIRAVLPVAFVLAFGLTLADPSMASDQESVLLRQVESFQSSIPEGTSESTASEPDVSQPSDSSPSSNADADRISLVCVRRC